jgi:hypothetical protein
VVDAHGASSVTVLPLQQTVCEETPFAGMQIAAVHAPCPPFAKEHTMNPTDERDARGEPAANEAPAAPTPAAPESTAQQMLDHPAGAMIGATAGAAAGMVSGIAAGPVGSLAGAIVGGVMGAVAGSRPAATSSGEPVVEGSPAQQREDEDDDDAASAADTPNQGEQLQDRKLANAGIGTETDDSHEDLLTPPRPEDQQRDAIKPGLPDFARGA